MRSLEMLLPKNSGFFSKMLLYPSIAALGLLFSWRLTEIPSRAEITIACSIAIVVPSLKYPKIALYYLLSFPCFVPFFRRLYYLVRERPDTDYLMLISDGVMLCLFIAIIMLWIVNKQYNRDKLSLLILVFIIILIIKIFLINAWGIKNGLYAFKFYGLYILLYFAGSALLENKKDLLKFLYFSSTILLITALYSIKQILFGYAEFEKSWIEAVEFTTLFIEGQIRTFSTYASPAALSDAMNILIIFAIYIFTRPGLGNKLYSLALLGAALPPLLFATVRTNWIAGISGIWLLFLFFNRLNWKISLLNLLVLPGIIFLILNYSNFGSERQNVSFQRNLNIRDKSLTEIMIKKRAGALVNPIEEYSMQKRLNTWYQIILETWYHYPLGKGLGTANYAHSFYIQILGETGYFGFFVFLLILISILTRGFYLIKYTQDTETHRMAAILTTIIIIISILNITGTHMNSHPSDIFFWFSAGCLTTLYRQSRKERETIPMVKNAGD